MTEYKIIVKDPVVKNNIFEEDYFQSIKEYFANHEVLKQEEYHYYGSKRVDSYTDPKLDEIHKMLMPMAKEIFGSETLLPTYAVFSEYSGHTAYLDKHKDVGPCTYTIDICLYKGADWPLFIEGKGYNWGPNEGIFFYANDQDHWKEDFPEKDNNKTGLLFLHYVEPDHQWWSVPEKMRPILRNSIKHIKKDD